MPPKNDAAEEAKAEETKAVPEATKEDVAAAVAELKADADHEEAAKTAEDLPHLEEAEEEHFPEPAIPVLPEDAKAIMQNAFPVLRDHGTHNAAVSGLQTDASGQYTHPSQL